MFYIIRHCGILYPTLSHCIFLQFTLSEIIYLTCVLVMFFDCMCPSVYLSGCLRVKIAYRKTIFGIFRRFLFFIFSIASQAMSLLVPKKFVFCSYPFPTTCPPRIRNNGKHRKTKNFAQTASRRKRI